jgi:hypothetical protein
MAAEGLLSEAGQDIQEQARSISACRLTKRDHFFFAQDTGNINKYERITSINMQNIYRYWQTLNKRSHKEV